MSFNIGSILGAGVDTLLNPVGTVLGALGGGSSQGSSSGSLDPLSLESALSQQSSCFTNINTLSSLAQSAPQSDNLLASLIDGDQS
jgi:hypothetical protein